MKLRPYQQKSLDDIRAAFADGNRGVILQLSTGAGKTKIFCEILKGAYAKGKRGVVCVKGIQLVHQASERLTREGVPHGIFQGDKTKDTHHKILVCSIDTLYARRIAPPCDIAIIDECHSSCSGGYRWFLENNPNTYLLGVSATPHHRFGMRHLASKIVYPITINELIGQGFLCSGRYFTPFFPDLKGVHKSGDDYNAKELGARAKNDKELTANCASVWDKHLRGNSTLCFAVSVEHARVLADALVQKGARVATVVANTPDGKRRDYIGRLESGAMDILVSVGVLTTGVDIPSLRAILCCRPTESYNTWVQILGRATRPYAGKKNFLCYDLAGNLYRHGPIESEAVASLDGQLAVPKISLKTCLECYATFESGPTECPSCGASTAISRARLTGKRIHGLTDNDEVKEVAVEEWQKVLPGLIATAKGKGHRKGSIYVRLKLMFGEAVADKAWPSIRSLKRWEIKSREKNKNV